MTKTPKRPMEIDDLFALRLVSEPAIAPDDSRVVWVVTRLDREDDAYKAALWIADLDGGNARQLTSGQHRDTAPSWSPDGSKVAFVSNRPAKVPKAEQDGQQTNGKPLNQVWVIDPNGGEARQVTAHPGGAATITWSPDGRKIAFVGADEPGADDTFTAPVTIGSKADEMVVHDIRYRFDGKGWLKRFSHIWAAEVTTGESVQLTHGPVFDSGPAWSSNGRQIAFVRGAREVRERSGQVVHVVSANGGEPVAITPEAGSFASLAWSPDSTKLAFLGQEDASTGFGKNTRVWTVGADGADLSDHTADTDITFSDAGMSDLGTGAGSPPAWLDDTSLLVSGSEHGATRVFRLPLSGGKPKALTPDNRRVIQFAASPNGAILVQVAGRIDQPFRLISAGIDGDEEAVLHDPNEDQVSEVEVATPIELDVTAPDGGKVQTWLLPPHGLDPEGGVKYPLILEIHGGPHSMYGHGMFHEMQVMAGRGYGVLFCNPRGSSGYGEAFATCTQGTWGESDMRDVMAAVDEASKLAWVDTERLGVTGGSYGGYLTNWIIGHDDRFKAAVTQRCVSNFHSFIGTSDIGFDFGIFEFDGTPWADAEKLLKYSPISYVDKMTTPLLIIHSEQDLRCPIEQAEQMFTALRHLDREVGFVRIPEEGHELSRSGTPSRRVARLHHLIGWFDAHL